MKAEVIIHKDFVVFVEHLGRDGFAEDSDAS
jgi:hypothetical protein